MEQRGTPARVFERLREQVERGESVEPSCSRCPHPRRPGGRLCRCCHAADERARRKRTVASPAPAPAWASVRCPLCHAEPGVGCGAEPHVSRVTLAGLLAG